MAKQLLVIIKSKISVTKVLFENNLIFFRSNDQASSRHLTIEIRLRNSKSSSKFEGSFKCSAEGFCCFSEQVRAPIDPYGSL